MRKGSISFRSLCSNRRISAIKNNITKVLKRGEESPESVKISGGWFRGPRVAFAPRNQPL